MTYDWVAIYNTHHNKQQQVPTRLPHTQTAAVVRKPTPAQPSAENSSSSVTGPRPQSIVAPSRGRKQWWIPLGPNIEKNTKTQISGGTPPQKTNCKRLGKHVCKMLGSISRKRRGHWLLKEFGLCLNQPVEQEVLLYR